jgi:hypothetical protein
MMGFFLMLIVVGGLGSLVAIADPTRAKLFPFTLAMFFSGMGVYILALGLGYLGSRIFSSSTPASLLFLIGLLVGSIGGAIFGFVVATRRNSRLSEGKDSWPTNGV